MTESKTDEILYTRADGVLTIQLNREKAMNAVTWAHIAEIAGVLDGASYDDGVRVVVITGTGKAFCAGGDIKDQKKRTEWPLTEKVVKGRSLVSSVTTVYNFPKPIIAAVNGVAAGAGSGLALLSDFRYAAESAKFGFPFVNVGLGTDYGVSYTLPRTVGPGVAARLLYTAAYVKAPEALQIGLVDRVLPDADLLPAAYEFAAEIASKAPFALRTVKQSLRRSGDSDFATSVAAEMQGQFIAMMTEDHAEGVTAFVEKRPPEFSGR